MSYKEKFTRLYFAFPRPHEFFLPDQVTLKKIIMITPLLGRIPLMTDMAVERSFARFFADRGVPAILIHRPIFQYDEASALEQVHHYVEESIVRNRQVLDATLQKKEFSDYDVGSLGLSFGSIINCLWAAEDERLKTNIFALAGGDLPDIFMRSTDPLMRAHFTSAKRSTGHGEEELRANLRKVFKKDPLDVAENIKTPDNLMILARFDHVVPYKNGLRLKDKLNPIKCITLPFGHFTSILTVPMMKRVAMRFFQNPREQAL